ncbi:hypothetical protein CALCODRAFT_504604 [Calocera cornea HHB12733]|uniref:Uncharacterized protein n=1 Tax=Calocera cornea HHB12733 TaxID=1353952 RepID=A0A165CBP5_9BASI|nr:hypothetical protein CALCODRAFT_504604 [Calocera cornea HHB12733]
MDSIPQYHEDQQLLLPNNLYLRLFPASGMSGEFELCICFSEDGLKGTRTTFQPDASGERRLMWMSTYDDRNTHNAIAFVRLADLGGETGRRRYEAAASTFAHDLSDGKLNFRDATETIVGLLDYLHQSGMTLASGDTLMREAQAVSAAHYLKRSQPAVILDSASGIATLAP